MQQIQSALTQLLSRQISGHFESYCVKLESFTMLQTNNFIQLLCFYKFHIWKRKGKNPKIFVILIIKNKIKKK